MKKTPEKIVTLLHELSEDTEQWSTDQGGRRRSAGVHRVESFVALQSKIAAIAQDIKKLTIAQVQNQPQLGCDICKIGHPTHECQTSSVEEEVKALGNFNRGNYQGGNNFNSMGHRHLVFLWSSSSGSLDSWQQQNPRALVQGSPSFQNQQRQQYPQPPQPNNSSLEDLMKAFIKKSNEKLEPHRTTIREQGITIREQGTTIQNLERQMGQIASLLSERAPRTLPSHTNKNPKGMIKSVSLRSGKTLADPIAKLRVEGVIKSARTAEEQKIGESLATENIIEKKGDKPKSNSEVEESKHMPVLPFPQKMKREKLDICFGKFLEMLKQLYANIPFIEVLTQMPV
ncbi:PREDICTED: uncharacterized protein LOC109239469 [Nicotiana attenuata]|uniref:uncharacterized protein LOC109239469 n=1 Tax=Nicotiana attenuata TaxID=49451 RepID=UPI000905612F|nr:PREDICTED: uncharacterized protein LOC109239469 [Nicotiana attenuata]